MVQRNLALGINAMMAVVSLHLRDDLAGFPSPLFSAGCAVQGLFPIHLERELHDLPQSNQELFRVRYWEGQEVPVSVFLM